MSNDSPVVLHCGHGGAKLPFYMRHCREVSVDIAPETNPDILADMADLPSGIGPFDHVFSQHSLEHLPVHQVTGCLAGWLKVLRTGGTVQVWVPDLEDLKPNNEFLYDSDGGPVYARDLFYGHHLQVPFFPYMQHLSGFIAETLQGHLEAAGFINVKVVRTGREGPVAYNLIGIGEKP